MPSLSPQSPSTRTSPAPDVAVDLPSLKVRGNQCTRSSLLAPQQELPSGSRGRGRGDLPLPLPSRGVRLWDCARDCGGRPPAAALAGGGESGDANLRPTSEEAISKTAITRKGNKSPRTSETFTHGEPGPCTVIRAMCLQNGIIYTEIFHRERSGAGTEG